MTITATKKAGAGSVPALVLGGSKVEDASAFKALNAADKRYLLAALKNEKRKEFARLVTLPSGERLLVMRATERLTHRKAILAVRRMVRLALEERIARISFAFDEIMPGSKPPAAQLAEVLATQALLASFEYTPYKEAPKEGWASVTRVDFVTDDPKAIASGVETGTVIGEESNAARALSNTPGGDMTPALLAAHAVELGKRAGFKVKVLDVKEMTSLGMGGVLGVGRGSSVPPRFIVAEFMNGPKGEAPSILAGKGVTFDTGGINIKAGGASYEMHLDMSGGAAVLHVLAIMARLGVKRSVVALVPAVENMPSGESYRPGDLLRTISGKTIEVLNTDAEGRVILADALGYAKRYQPKEVIDVATLTGAACIALGLRMSGLFTPDDQLAADLVAAGEVSGDFAWRMPVWEEFEAEVKGTFGDVANMGKKAPYGGAITAATFLWQFAKDFRWAHLDIAPRMTSVDDEYLGKGSVAASVQLLATYLRT